MNNHFDFFNKPLDNKKILIKIKKLNNSKNN